MHPVLYAMNVPRPASQPPGQTRVRLDLYVRAAVILLLASAALRLPCGGQLAVLALASLASAALALPSFASAARDFAVLMCVLIGLRAAAQLL